MPQGEGDEGEEVHWWILVKPSGDKRFAYSSSGSGSKGKARSFPLKDGVNIDDIRYSPFLRTVYDSKPLKKDVPEDDNRLHLAWNDQQPHGGNKSKKASSTKAASAESKTQGHEKRLAYLDPNLEEISYKDGVNAYGQLENTVHAHSKGFAGISVIKKSETKALVEMYVITHSFPRTPNGPLMESDEYPIQRRFVPDNPKDFFGRNILVPTSKAQHAMCISMHQEVTLKNGIIQFDRSKLDLHNMNLFAFLNGLDIIGPSITLTNYVPWLAHFKVYHQLFDIRSSWSSKPFKLDDKVATTNIARSLVAKKTETPTYSDHAFPLWPSRWHVEVNEKGKVVNQRSYKAVGSLRDQSQIYATRCRVWQAALDGRKDPGCLASATLTSTGENPLVINFVAKSGRVIADVDDIVSSRLLPKRDWELASKEVKPGEQVAKKYVTFLTIWQTWITHSTLSPHLQVISDTPRLKAAVYHYNSYGHTIPTNKGGTVPQPASGYNHSKWFLSYLFGQKGRIKVIAGVTDLNRDATATALSSKKAGRGGFFFITSNPEFVRFFLSLEPIIEDNNTFTNLPMSIFTKDYNDEPVIPVSFVKRIAKTGDGMEIILPRFAGDDEPPKPEKYALPFCEIPESVMSIALTAATGQCSAEAPLSPSKLPIGKEDFVSGSPMKRIIHGTPQRFKRTQVQSRVTKPQDQEYSKSEEECLKDTASQEVDQAKDKQDAPNRREASRHPAIAKNLLSAFTEPDEDDSGQKEQPSHREASGSIVSIDILKPSDRTDVVVKVGDGTVSIPSDVYGGWSRPWADPTNTAPSNLPAGDNGTGHGVPLNDPLRPHPIIIGPLKDKPTVDKVPSTVGTKGTEHAAGKLDEKRAAKGTQSPPPSGRRIMIDLTQSSPQKRAVGSSQNNAGSNAFVTTCDVGKSGRNTPIILSSSTNKSEDHDLSDSNEDQDKDAQVPDLISKSSDSDLSDENTDGGASGKWGVRGNKSGKSEKKGTKKYNQIKKTGDKGKAAFDPTHRIDNEPKRRGLPKGEPNKRKKSAKEAKPLVSGDVRGKKGSRAKKDAKVKPGKDRRAESPKQKASDSKKKRTPSAKSKVAKGKQQR